MKLSVLFFSVCSTIGLFACAPQLPRPQVLAGSQFATGFDTGAPPQPVPVAPGQPTRSVLLKSMGISPIPNNQDVGANGVGPNCTLAGPIKVTSNNVVEAPSISYARAFYETLKANNYDVMGNPDDLFEDKSQLRPDYLVAVTVTEMKENRCYQGDQGVVVAAFGTDVQIGLQWQFFDAATNSVVLKASTHGYAKGSAATDPQGFAAAHEAITNNVRMLLADPAVHELLTLSAPTSPVVHRQVRLPAIEKDHGFIQGNLKSVENSAIIIS